MSRPQTIHQKLVLKSRSQKPRPQMRILSHLSHIPFSIIEVGSWKGRSTVELAKACENITTTFKKACHVIAIDTWLGSSEHYETASLTPKYAHEYATE